MLTQKRLKELLHYVPSTGVFVWKGSAGTRGRTNKARRTSTALTPHGYTRISVDMKRYQTHRLAFLFIEGYFPEFEVDHLNGIRDDNRWCNLRHVTPGCNRQNQKKRSDNKSGFPGVSFDKRCRRWAVEIRFNNRKTFICYSDDKFEAALTRLTVEVQCPEWSCNHRGELVKAIKQAWSGFNDRCLS